MVTPQGSNLYQPVNIEARRAALTLRALAVVEIRSVGAVAVATKLAIFGTAGADQHPDILQVVGAGPVRPRNQNLIVCVDVAKLAF